MTDYIKREDVLGEFTYDDLDEYYTPQIMAIVGDIPSADVEEVVRCKDCKWKANTIGESWCDFHEFTILSDDDYCSHGERRDDEID